MGRKCRPVFRFATCCFAIALALAPSAALSAEYFASPNGTGTGTKDSPYSLSSGISKIDKSSHTLILLKGTYKLDKAIALTGPTTEGKTATVRGETGDPADVILDAQGEREAMRIARNVFVTGLTVTNGSNASYANSKTASDLAIRAAGIRVGSYNGTGKCIVSNCVVTCCTNAFNSGTKNSSGNVVYGGAVCVYGNGLLVNSTVTGNTAVYRSAGVVVYDGEVRGCTISGNTAVSDGGGVFVERGASALVADSVITGNYAGAEAGGGGAACYMEGSSLTLTNCTISGNTARQGAGVNSWGGTTLKCIDCRIENNEAVYYGGGIRVSGTCNAEISGSVFDGNKTTTSSTSEGTYNQVFGGGVAVYAHAEGAALVVSNCVFRNNQSASRGGAIGASWGKDSTTGTVYADIVDCVFTNNTAYRQGGAVCVRDQTDKDVEDKTTIPTRFRMRNCLVARNKTTLNSTTGANGGGVYFVSYANPVLDSCTIVSNATVSSSVTGAGIYHRWGGTVTNCIIAFNMAGSKMETGSGWCYNADAYSHCCVWPALKSVFLEDEEHGCVNKDPMFKDADAGDYTLAAGSKCRDAGIYDEWMEGAFDLAGNARVAGNGVDIGCYEYRPPRGLRIVLR